jgi:integrase
VEIDLRYLSEELDRHGNLRLYARRYGRRVRIRVKRHDPEFLNAYQAALETLEELSGRAAPSNQTKKKTALRGTLGWLASLYFGSDEFLALPPKSQSTRRGVIEECLRETVKEGSSDLTADCPLSYFTPAKVKRLRDLKRAKGLPGAANNRRKHISAMFGWAVEEGHVTANPCRDVRRVRYATDGYHTWTVPEVVQFTKRHPLGTKPYLAMCLLLFTGTRTSDMIRLGPQHACGDLLAFVPRKTRHVRVDISHKPILPALAQAIAAGPVGKLAFLETQYGCRYSDKGIGNAMREWCDQAGLPQCTAHGLRKAGATIAAELGATTPQLMAIFDWATPGQAEPYIRAANRKRMANDAMPLLSFFSLQMNEAGTSQEQSFVSPANPTLSHRNTISDLAGEMAGVEGLEPPTPGFGDRCSSH